MITHEVIIKERGSKPGLYYKLAEGSAIQALEGDLYVVDDKQYYIKINPSLQPSIRDANGKKELIVPMANCFEIFNYLVRLKSNHYEHHFKKNIFNGYADH